MLKLVGSFVVFILTFFTLPAQAQDETLGAWGIYVHTSVYTDGTTGVVGFYRFGSGGYGYQDFEFANTANDKAVVEVIEEVWHTDGTTWNHSRVTRTFTPQGVLEDVVEEVVVEGSYVPAKHEPHCGLPFHNAGDQGINIRAQGGRNSEVVGSLPAGWSVFSATGTPPQSAGDEMPVWMMLYAGFLPKGTGNLILPPAKGYAFGDLLTPGLGDDVATLWWNEFAVLVRDLTGPLDGTQGDGQLLCVQRYESEG